MFDIGVSWCHLRLAGFSPQELRREWDRVVTMPPWFPVPPRRFGGDGSGGQGQITAHANG